LFNLSLKYLEKAIQYLLKNDKNNENNMIKLFAIAYIKKYCYYYVEINFNYRDKCNSEKINEIIYNQDKNDEKITKMINIYILRLYCRKYENFDKFISNNLQEQNIKIHYTLEDSIRELKKNEGNQNYIFKESFISSENFADYENFLFNLPKNDFNIENINKNFDNYYCCLVNKVISN
jgi:hypothetical protein